MHTNISKLSGFLSKADSENLIHAFITSRLDYCNGLFTGVPKSAVQRLQLTQNAAALEQRSLNVLHLSLDFYTGSQSKLELILRYCSKYIKFSMPLHLSILEKCSLDKNQQEHPDPQAWVSYPSLAVT